MDTYFKKLGQTVLARWKKTNFSLTEFPGIAEEAINARPPSDHVDLTVFLKEFLLNDEQPFQTQSGFGQPEIVAFDHPRFYIQLLFWMDGTTDIHQHEFSGAFHVMTGSSIHAHFNFENVRAITPYLQMGDVRMRKIELLETGRTVPIVSGSACVHSLFHLDTPSVTVVVRTQNDPGTGPQFNYLPPHMAVDPVFSDALLMRRRQLLDLLARVESPEYPDLVRAMIRELDFERGFYILQSNREDLRMLGLWPSMLREFEKTHKRLANGVAATLEEEARREMIKGMRGMIHDSGRRFFLALLMNVDSRSDLLQLVKKRFPEKKPIETVLQWMSELMEWGDTGITILDASFPESLDVAPDAQPDMLISALRHLMIGSKKAPSKSSGLTLDEMIEIQSALTASSLRVLVA